MGLFKSLFGGKDTEGGEQKKEAISWIHLSSLEQLEEIEELSLQRPQLIFKHSTSCGISNMVLRMFKESYSFEAEAADVYYLDLHRYRQVSNEVAYKFGVYHQSPQLIIIRNKKVIGHSSHGAITELELDKFI